jgi:predicted O-methyltransferase YrrM
MSHLTLNLTPAVYDYLLQHTLREPSILQQLRDETAKLPMAAMQISPEQGQFMALLIQLIQAKKTLDIGTFTGYSALVVALAMHADGKVVACDNSTQFTNIAKRYWEQAGVANKMDLRIAPALETLQALLDNGESGSFDFAFIDADKANYLEYYELSLKLLRQGGLIAVDNVLWSGSVADKSVNDRDTKAIRIVNEKIHQDPRVTICMLPIGDGLTLARKC